MIQPQLIPMRPGRYRLARPDETRRVGSVAPLSLRYLEPARLAGTPPKFNASIIRHDGKLVMAYRTGRGGASRLWLTELDENLCPCRRCWPLRVEHPWANVGQEDPRLFVHDDRLYVSFVGTEGKDFDHLARVSVMLLRMDRSGRQVERLIAPHYPARGDNEKNWQWFSSGGSLYAVYSVLPHTILRLDGESLALVHETPWSPAWIGGRMRGGASPVLIDGEWWCFFHGKEDASQPTRYSIGVYTFEDRPPFRPLRYTPDPIAFCDMATKPADEAMEIVFPAGAVLDGDRWLVSAGMHDRQIAVYEFDKKTVEKAMISICPEMSSLSRNVHLLDMPPIYCLTLRQTPDRAAKAKSHFANRELNVRMIEGIHGNRWGLETALWSHRDGNGYQIPPGHAALIINHWFLWLHLSLLDPVPAETLILEDDAFFEEDFHLQYALSRAALPEDWDFWFVGSVGMAGKNRKMIGDRLCRFEGDIYGTQAYLVRDRALPILLETMQELRHHVDIQLSRNALPKLNWYASWPSLVSNLSYEGVVPGACHR